MQDATIKFVSKRLKWDTDLSKTEIDSIVEALKEGQVYKKMFDDVDETMRDYKENSFSMHQEYKIYTNEDYLLGIVERAKAKFLTKPKDIVIKREDLSLIDKAVLKGIKRIADAFFDALEKRLEKEG